VVNFNNSLNTGATPVLIHGATMNFLSSNTLNVLINGTGTRGTAYTAIGDTSTASMQLGGILQVAWTGATPTLGATYNLLQATSIVGNFSSIVGLPSLGSAQLGWRAAVVNISGGQQQFNLMVVSIPEPATLTFLVAGGLGMSAVVRRRRRR